MDLLRHLKFFVTIAEEEHFGRAANQLGMAQPPLSQGLQRLERGLGVVLMTRSSREVRLTSAGQELLPLARGLLRSADEFRDTAKRHGARKPSLRLGVIPHLSAELTGTLTATARSVLGDDIRRAVELTVAPTTTLVDAVTAGQLDIAVVHHPAVLGSLHSGPVISLKTAVLIPASHPTAGAATVSPRALAGLPIAAPPRSHGPAAHDLLVDTLEQRGLPVDILPVDTDREALALVAAGQAIAFTSDAGLSCPGVSRLRLTGDPIPLRLRLVWNSPPSDGIIEALEAALNPGGNR